MSTSSTISFVKYIKQEELNNKEISYCHIIDIVKITNNIRQILETNFGPVTIKSIAIVVASQDDISLLENRQLHDQKKYITHITAKLFQLHNQN